MQLGGAELAALDVETTGLSVAGGDRVIEVAVVRGRFGEAPRTWSTLVDPGRPVGSTEIHGITDAMLGGQPRFAAIAATLAEQLEGAVLVAHNARFDLSFLRMEHARAGLVVPEPPVIDTLSLARRVLALRSNGLASVCAHLGIGRARAHRALDDARATWEVAWRLLAELDPDLRMHVSDVDRLCRRPSPAERRALAEALRAAARQAEPIVIDYRRADAVHTRRPITVHRVRRARVEAWCHLRGEERVFRLDRISLVPP